ncbi:hypothetical protein JOD54_005937 [Actinokineospora baliensis]|nr:hypothetical protein [Actinokineospora baliensis]
MSGDPSTPQPDVIKACALLSGSDAQALGITDEGKATDTASRSSCLWRVEKPVIADSYSISVTFFKELAVGDLVTSQEKSPVRIGKHNGVKALGDSDSGCIVALEVTVSSRVDVRAIGGDSAGLCGVAMGAAERVEARLP